MKIILVLKEKKKKIAFEKEITFIVRLLKPLHLLMKYENNPHPRFSGRGEHIY